MYWHIKRLLSILRLRKLPSMKTSTARLKWLIEFTENYEDADFREGSGLQDWQQLKLEQEIKDFIAGLDETSGSRIEFAIKSDDPEKRVAKLVLNSKIALRDMFRLRHRAGFALGSFTPKGVAVRAPVPSKGSRVS